MAEEQNRNKKMVDESSSSSSPQQTESDHVPAAAQQVSVASSSASPVLAPPAAPPAPPAAAAPAEGGAYPGLPALVSALVRSIKGKEVMQAEEKPSKKTKPPINFHARPAKGIIIREPSSDSKAGSRPPPPPPLSKKPKLSLVVVPEVPENEKKKPVLTISSSPSSSASDSSSAYSSDDDSDDSDDDDDDDMVVLTEKKIPSWGTIFAPPNKSGKVPALSCNISGDDPINAADMSNVWQNATVLRHELLASVVIQILKYMPMVSTNAGIPGGKITKGFLFKYRLDDATIICACHGLLFNAKTFVKHAGGDPDVQNPARLIDIELFKLTKD